METHPKIRHEGRVETVSEQGVLVRIVQKTACAGCHSAQVCHAADQREKFIDVASDGHPWKVGELVWVVGDRRTGHTAVLLAFVIPVILMLMALALCQQANIEEALSAMVALLVVACYSGVLWLLRHRLKGKFVFTIEPIETE